MDILDPGLAGALRVGLASLLAGVSGHGDREAADAANRARAPLAERLQARGFHLGDPAYVRIFKQENRLEVWLGKGGRYHLFETYPICRWSGALGPKLKEGDGQAPEGFYGVKRSQLNPHSAYTLAFNLGFPNAYDRALSRTGSALMVHGACASVGCYAMTDPGIRDIYALVDAGLDHGQPAVPVDIFPFRMTPNRLRASASHQWVGFWSDLAKGDRVFQATGRPPAIYVCQGRYDTTGKPGCVQVRRGG